jgi:predicted component of type VI protein secretion system
LKNLVNRLPEINRIVAGDAARVAVVLRALVASLRRLRPLIERVDRCVEALKDLLRRADRTHAAPEEDPPKKPLDPEDEAMRVHDLGVDPAVARYRPNEAQTAALVEIQLGVTLQRAAPGEPADWVDERGRTYDAVGPFPARYFARQWTQLRYQITRHLGKADLVPVDVSEFTADQTARVKRHISDNNLGPRIFLVGQ